MSVPIVDREGPRAVCLIRAALDRVRPTVADADLTPRERLQALWAIAVATRNMATRDAWGDEIVRLAVESGLFACLHRRDWRSSAIDLHHVIAWAWLGRNPWR